MPQEGSYQGIALAMPQEGSYQGIALAMPQEGSYQGIALAMPQEGSYQGIALAMPQEGSYQGIALAMPSVREIRRPFRGWVSKHEYLRSLHQAPRRNLVASGGAAAFRSVGIQVSARSSAAAGGVPRN